MSNQQKKINVLLLSVCAVTSVLAIYFGVKTQQLTKQLSEQNKTVEEETDTAYTENIAKIDSLLFKGEYKEALKISNSLKETEDFKDDSLLQTRYKLASDMVAVKKEKDTSSNIIIIEKENTNTNSQNNLIAENQNPSLTQKLMQTEQKLANVKAELVSTKKSSEYLTFKTTKGTSLHYIGAIKNNNANGYGVAILKSGSRYEGQWKNNKRHGYGKFFWDDGDYYEGIYVDDKRNGYGTYHWKNGEKYIGEWKDDKRNGHGEFFNKKGKLKTSGNWENDELIKQDEKVKKHKDSLSKK